MKKLQKITLMLVCIGMSFSVWAQADKSKRPSPPAQAKQTIASGATVTIDYSQPAVKGRIIGETIEPMDGQVWRTGANEATVFEVSKLVKVNGKDLAAGKYGLFTIAGKEGWIIIFNKTWDQWGAYGYKEADDVLRVNATRQKAESFAERMTFTIDKDGLVGLLWGNDKVTFTVQ